MHCFKTLVFKLDVESRFDPMQIVPDLCWSLVMFQVSQEVFLVHYPSELKEAEWCAIGVQWRSVMGVVMRH